MQRQNYTPAALPGTRWLQGAAGAAYLVGTVVMGGMAPIPGNGNFQTTGWLQEKLVNVLVYIQEQYEAGITGHTANFSCNAPQNVDSTFIAPKSCTCTPFIGNLQNAL